MIAEGGAESDTGIMSSRDEDEPACIPKALGGVGYDEIAVADSPCCGGVLTRRTSRSSRRSVQYKEIETVGTEVPEFPELAAVETLPSGSVMTDETTVSQEGSGWEGCAMVVE